MAASIGAGRRRRYAGEETLSIARLQEGDQTEFERYYEKTYDYVRNYAWSILKEPEEADLVATDSFLKYWKMAPAFTTFSEVRQFLFKCVRNASIDILRKRTTSRSNQKELEYLLRQEEENSMGSTIAQEIRTEVMTKIAQNIFALPERQQEIFRMIYFEDLPVKEIAVLLGVSESTVRTQHMHIKNHFRKLFAEKDLFIFSVLALAVYTVLKFIIRT